ncbi:MAG: prepilin-type N-terminal cleavage/methylation domain-containing protein [Kiritimatiellae bacterium]|nr:prepilin-type N-terminal cleavage/methylation domain-containing protein [Kiritimatiellia bacterium]
MKISRKGFTLVEIMIVVAIIGILAAIAIPNFLKSRQESQMKACIANLKQIEGAQEQILLSGTALTDDGVKEYLKGTLSCPTDKAAYVLTTTPPVCPTPVAGHVLPTTP